MLKSFGFNFFVASLVLFFIHYFSAFFMSFGCKFKMIKKKKGEGKERKYSYARKTIFGCQKEDLD